MYYVDNQMNKKPLIPVIRRMLNIKSDNTARAEYRCSLLLLVFLILNDSSSIYTVTFFHQLLYLYYLWYFWALYMTTLHLTVNQIHFFIKPKITITMSSLGFRF